MFIALGLLLLAIAVRRRELGKWWRRRRHRRAPPKALTRFPIVLAHGLGGFDDILLGTRRLHYFRGVPDHLRGLGATVHIAGVAPLASIAQRAEQLAAHVEALAAPRVIIIAHSMGGLDARFAISKLGLHRRVAGLVTIGTPHRGTPVADKSAGVLGANYGMPWLLSRVGLDVGALYDLTTARMAAFNANVRDVRGVDYACFLASVSREKLNPLLWPLQAFVSQVAGPNDGLVPESSQRWGEVLGHVQADHWAQIGWSSRFDAPALYSEILRVLAAKGW
jgi:triacylglycerol lipase